MKTTARKSARPGAAKNRSGKVARTSESSRIIFTFDKRSLQILEDMTRESEFPSMAATVRAALRVVRSLQEQAKRGFSDVIVQDPDTLEQRRLVIDFLDSVKADASLQSVLWCARMRSTWAATGRVMPWREKQ